MSTFRDVSSLPPDAFRSATKDSVNSGHLRDVDACKCGDANAQGRSGTAEPSNKLPGLLNVNQRLSDENELLRQCIVRLMENADLQSMNALTMIMSQNDERLRKFISESIMGNNSKDKATSLQGAQSLNESRLPNAHTITNDTESYGTSFKEVRLSELDGEPVTRETNASKVTNSNGCTSQTPHNYRSPNKASFQSYGKSFKEINLSELNNGSHLASSNDARLRTEQHTSLLKSKVDSEASDFKSYGKSFKEIQQSELNSVPYFTSSNDPRVNREHPVQSQLYSNTSDFNSYGKSFKEIQQSELNSLPYFTSSNDPRVNREHPVKSQLYSNTSDVNSYGQSFQTVSLRELGGESEFLGSSRSSRHAKSEKVRSPKTPGNVLLHSNHTNDPKVVLQPPMKFGMGSSPYQKSPKSPVPQKHNGSHSRSAATEQPLVNKRKRRDIRRRNANSPYYSQHQTLSKVSKASNSSKMPVRPMSTPLTTGVAIFTKVNKLNLPDDDLPPSIVTQIDTGVSLPALLKHILENEENKTKDNTPKFCMDCTNVPCKCNPKHNMDVVNERILNASGETFFNDSLDKTIDQKSQKRVSSVDETTIETINVQVNGSVNASSQVSQEFPTMTTIASPKFYSTKIPKTAGETRFYISPGHPQTDPYISRYEHMIENMNDQSISHHETHTFTDDSLLPVIKWPEVDTTLMHRDQQKPFDYDREQGPVASPDVYSRTPVNKSVGQIISHHNNGMASQNQNEDRTNTRGKIGNQNIGIEVTNRLVERTMLNRNAERQPYQNKDIQSHGIQQNQHVTMQSSQMVEVQPNQIGETRLRNKTDRQPIPSFDQEPNASIADKIKQFLYQQSRNFEEQFNQSMERASNNDYTGKTFNSKVEEQPYSKEDRTVADLHVGQPTTHTDMDLVKIEQTVNQTASDVIGRPLAFSTPKESHADQTRHAPRDKSSVIQTTVKPLNLVPTPAATHDSVNGSTHAATRDRVNDSTPVTTHDTRSVNDSIHVATLDSVNVSKPKQSSVSEAYNSAHGIGAAKEEIDEKSQDVVPERELMPALPNPGNDEQLQEIEFLAKTMRFRGTTRAKYVLHRAIDTLLRYKPNLQYTASVIQTAGNPNAHLVGEISFQLDRRILEFVFDGMKEKMGKRRSRYYGYSVASILQLIDKEVKYADNDAEINKILRQRLEDILKKLHSLGYKIECHAVFAQDMVNQFGLLNGEPEPGTLEYLGMKEPAILRAVLGHALHDKDLDSMLVILDCLLYMAYQDGRPIFVW